MSHNYSASGSPLLAASMSLFILFLLIGQSNALSTVTSQNVSFGGAVNFTTVQGAQVGLNQPNATNIVGPTIIRLPNGAYRMYFQSRAQSGYVNVMSATSTDGVHWTYDSGIRVQHGPSQSSIDWQIGEPDVIQGYNGTYLMAYTGRQAIPGAPPGAYFHKIVFASSTDDLNWTKDNYNFSDPSQTGGFTSSADILKLGGKYVMYYTGCCQTVSGIFMAQSTNFVNWQVIGSVFGVGHDSSTIELNGTYYMFFMAPSNFVPNQNMNQDVLLMAVSNDGTNWSDEIYPVAITNSSNGSAINTSTLGDPAAMLAPDGSLLVYVNGPMGQSIFGIKPTSQLPKIRTPPSSSATTTTPQQTTTGTTQTSIPVTSTISGTTVNGTTTIPNSTQSNPITAIINAIAAFFSNLFKGI